MTRMLLASGASLMALVAATPALAQSDDDRIDALEARVAELEAMNRQLMEMMMAESSGDTHMEIHRRHHGDGEEMDVEVRREVRIHTETADGAGERQMVVMIDQGGEVEVHQGADAQMGLVGVSSDYGYRILDHAEGVNTRQLTQLQAIQNGELPHRVTLSGGVTALANIQRSNSDTKFGWLMRHPTSNNQIGEDVSEFVVHSAQLATTARLTDDLTAYVEFLYNPEQSFGSGTITDLNRNQVQVRKAYVLWGDLDERPWYAALGKMDTPFGLQDTVSPFTNSTMWHSFAGLAYGGMVGYYNDGLHVRAMGIQGGAQFRAANSPVQDTSVPSRVNNFAVDANYTHDMGDGDSLMVGASYEYGSPYCQGYPVFHFNPCDENNPAYSVYGVLDMGDFRILGEYARTTEVWAGSAVPAAVNPALAVFDAVETTSWGIGGRYAMDIGKDEPFYLSAEFSTFIAGDDGAPWERQDQWVLGGSYFVTPSVNFFGELIHTEGWVPLNFLSGGNLPAGATWSESDAKTDVFTLGIQAAF